MLTAAWTDKGIRKAINQDSLLVEEADTDGDSVLFAAVCDGMGGLSYGEHASGEAVRALDKWFSLDVPAFLQTGFSDEAIADSLGDVIQTVHARLNAFSASHGACGTTLAGVMIGFGHFLCVNIGDSRVYRIGNGELRQLTHDQTVAQDEFDRGLVTAEELAVHPSRNVLLQCMGAGSSVAPAWTRGRYDEGDVFLLCSDGFRHKLSPDEIRTRFAPDRMTSEQAMTMAAREAVEENMRRAERDNISVILVQTAGGEPSRSSSSVPWRPPHS